MNLHAQAAYQLGFTSLKKEIIAPQALPLEGTIPVWLEGTLIRTAPSQFEVGREAYRHWFDGLAMLHRFAIRHGEMLYSNRFLQSDAFLAARQRGKIAIGEFATNPSQNFLDHVIAFLNPKITDNANVNVAVFDGKMVALTETPKPVIFDPETLQTLGGFIYDPKLEIGLTIAHPHYDTVRGCHYSLAVTFGRKTFYRLFSIDSSTGGQNLVASIEVDRPAYMHSFGMTDRYLILSEFPLVVNPINLRLSGRPFIENYKWDPSRGLRFLIIDKDTGKILRTAVTRPLFGFHHVNAYEEDNHVIADVITFKDQTIISELYLDCLRSGAPLKAISSLTRFKIPLGESQPISSETLGEGFELPQINGTACTGKPYRFMWGTGIKTEGGFADRIVKFDLHSRETIEWRKENVYPGEAVFVAAPAAKSEDDGVLLSVVLDAARQHSYLLILDAKTLAELARAEIPHHIPFGFHGNFYAKSQLNS